MTQIKFKVKYEKQLFTSVEMFIVLHVLMFPGVETTVNV